MYVRALSKHISGQTDGFQIVVRDKSVYPLPDGLGATSAIRLLAKQAAMPGADEYNREAAVELSLEEVQRIVDLAIKLRMVELPGTEQLLRAMKNLERGLGKQGQRKRDRRKKA